MSGVTDKHSVAHAWANKETGVARTTSNGSLYFIDNDIFSYGSHFMIAKHVTNSDGERAVLITQRTYSKTTSAHTGLVIDASRHLTQISVPDPADTRIQLLEKWYEEIKNTARLLKGAKKPRKYILEIRRIYEEAKSYADFFSFELPEHLQEAGAIQNAEQYSEVLNREIEQRKAEEKKRQKALIKLQAKNLKLWRKFERREIRTHDGWDYLRYNPASERVETSQKVEIPQSIARKFYALVLETIGKGGCEDCKTKLMDIYDVLAINKVFIQVGCHKISLKEIKSFTKQMGW